MCGIAGWVDFDRDLSTEPAWCSHGAERALVDARHRIADLPGHAGRQDHIGPGPGRCAGLGHWAHD